MKEQTYKPWTLVGPNLKNLVLKPLAVTSLNNQLYIIIYTKSGLKTLYYIIWMCCEILYCKNSKLIFSQILFLGSASKQDLQHKKKTNSRYEELFRILYFFRS